MSPQLLKKELAQRLKTNPKPSKIELAIGCFLEEIPEILRPVIEVLVEKGVTPRIWEEYDMRPGRIEVVGLTNKQALLLRANSGLIESINVFDRNLNGWRSDNNFIINRSVICNLIKKAESTWYDVASVLISNDQRPLISDTKEAKQFRELWRGTPDEYKGIPIDLRRQIS